ncbi:hypothetical protein [Rhizobium leguminosarum]|uniref:hypothetical protein n=1 Tax=Rhizobium leguminosarum TaxID=384 RepID=UPI001C946CAE|nr:hypothetical protein [Rhizobium leguminosarum]MBY5414177.1 hypothetical protein [Rhizobium leguminosarum]
MHSLDFRDLQISQQQHDLRNHSEILSLHKMERLKHYGLHYCKYVGRIARGNKEPKSLKATVVDATLICLSAANALNQRLWESGVGVRYLDADILAFADAVGRFADACEKLDHLEDFRSIAVEANSDVASWLISAAQAYQIDLNDGIRERRRVLSHRQPYHPE